MWHKQTYHSNKHIQKGIAHTVNHSQYELNKYSDVIENNIADQNQTLSSEKLQALLLSFKEQKAQDNSWSYCKQVQAIHVH